MAGTKAGGLKARDTNIAKHGRGFYAEIGTKGGKLGHTGGFAAKIECNCKIIWGSHYKQQCAGAIGGRISRRRKKVAE